MHIKRPRKMIEISLYICICTLYFINFSLNFKIWYCIYTKNYLKEWFCILFRYMCLWNPRLFAVLSAPVLLSSWFLFAGTLLKLRFASFACLQHQLNQNLYRRHCLKAAICVIFLLLCAVFVENRLISTLWWWKHV